MSSPTLVRRPKLGAPTSLGTHSARLAIRASRPALTLGAALVAALGTASLTACSDDTLAPERAEASAAVAAGEKLTGIGIEGDTARTLLVGESTLLKATLRFSAGGTLVAGSGMARWSSLAPAVASVSATGEVKGLARGTAPIVVTYAYNVKLADTVTVTVDTPLLTWGGEPTRPVEPVVGAELPREWMDTRVLPAPGRRLTVAPGGDIAAVQAAVDSALPGDVIELEPGATYTGRLYLRTKAGESYITITSADQRSLPAPGVRMNPARAAEARLPKIVSADDMAAIQTDSGAHHYRLLGLELVSNTAVPSTNMIVRFGATGSQQNDLSEVPHHLIVDRSYVHGFATHNTKRCVEINSAWTAVIDSYLSECHSSTQDSQAIAGWNGPGPFKVVNNYLEGAGETFMLGGSDPSIQGVIPTDVEVRGNHFYKPTSWVQVWLVKNSFELKVGRRVLVEGNVFDGSWTDGQEGYHWIIKSANQNGRCGWCITEHVTMRRNLLRNSGAGMTINGGEALMGGTVGRTNHVVIVGNRVESMNVVGSAYRGAGRPFLIGPVDYVTINHNTIDNGNLTNLVMFGSKPVGPEFRFINNIGYRNRYGFHSLSTYAPAAIITGNIFIASSGTTYGSGNWLAPTMDDALRMPAAGGAEAPGASMARLMATLDGVVQQ
jgi:hypothetical protein